MRVRQRGEHPQKLIACAVASHASPSRVSIDLTREPNDCQCIGSTEVAARRRILRPTGAIGAARARDCEDVMGIRLDGIHFLVTYRCTFACDHCFVWSSPEAEGTMTLEQLTAVIDQAADCGVETVYFEGGEPTLAYPIVLAAAEHATAPRPGLRHGQQLLLGEQRRATPRSGSPPSRPWASATCRCRPTPTSWRTRTRSTCATPWRRRASSSCPWPCSRSAPRRSWTCPASASARTSARSCARAGRPWSSPPGERPGRPRAS